MRSSLIRATLWIAVLAVAVAPTPPALAQEAAAGGDKVHETIEIKRAKQKGPKHPSLQFLKDNRVFLRAQLDRLSMQITREHTSTADMLDSRYLMLKAMAEAIAAARDTIQAEHDSTGSRTLLTSVTELGDLEAELALMERLLAEQSHRLLLLEEDFLGHQETALVVLIKGLAGKNAPASIVLTEDGEVISVKLSPDQMLSLEQGGIAQIYHEFVEPREHEFAVRFAGGAWDGTSPVSVSFEATRDKLTFLELDLRDLEPDVPAAGLLTSVWYR